MKSTSKTYSSVKEALESGALDLPNANHGRMPASSSNSASARHVGRSVAIALVASPSAAAAVDIAGLTREELRRLRSEDPFLYYSIPAARRRLHRFQDDETNAAASANEARDGNPPRESAAVPRRRSSDPGARRAPAQLVWRQRRLSVEAHPTLIIEDLEIWGGPAEGQGDGASRAARNPGHSA